MRGGPGPVPGTVRAVAPLMDEDVHYTLFHDQVRSAISSLETPLLINVSTPCFKERCGASSGPNHVHYTLFHDQAKLPARRAVAGDAQPLPHMIDCTVRTRPYSCRPYG